MAPSRETNWRPVAAFMLLAVATAVGLALSVHSVSRTTTIERRIGQRGSPCVDIRLPSGVSFPSQGCERLARLLSRTCTLNPSLCSGVVRAIARRDAAQARRLQRALRQVQRENLSLRRGRAMVVGGNEGGLGRGGPPRRAHRRPVVRHGTSPPVPSPAAGPTPPPTPSDVVNNAARRGVDTANDVTQAVGRGRPVPPPPLVPQVLPPLCPRPPLC